MRISKHSLPWPLGEIHIRNASGQVVKTQPLHRHSRLSLQLNEPPGIYYVSGVDKGKPWVRKVVKY
jgi:hypothetical protein